MFDGADLSLVYGGSGGYDMSPQGMAVSNPPPPPVVQSSAPEPPMVSPATMSHSTGPDLPYNPPSAMYSQQGPAMLPPPPTFWDRISERRGDVLKLVALSLVVLLGISLDRVTTHYLTGYISKAFLTDIQEFLVRLSYPVVVILVLWILKAMS